VNAQHNNNTLRILLGLSLVNQQESLFAQIVVKLGLAIHPFSKDFKQARKGYSQATRSLFELTLKATIACSDIDQTKTVLWFAKNHNYLLSIDEQTVMHSLFDTYPGKTLQGDYSLIRMLIELEVTYLIGVTEKNRESIKAQQRKETKKDVRGQDAIGGSSTIKRVGTENGASLVSSLASSKVTSRTVSREE
jgi:hypothetical protein